MKKLKLISLALSLLMVLSLIPMGALTAYAANTAPTPSDAGAPTTLPSGEGIYQTLPFTDYSKATVTQGPNWSISNGYIAHSIANSEFHTYSKGPILKNLHGWKGASGIMVYIDTTNATENAKLQFRFELPMNRTGGWVKFANRVAGCESVAYFYNGTTWDKLTNNGQDVVVQNNVVAEKAEQTGWYYIPWSSFYCISFTEGDGTEHMPIDEFLSKSRMQGLAAFYLWNSTAGAKYGDVHFVYPDTENTVSDNASKIPVFNNATVDKADTVTTNYGPDSSRFEITGATNAINANTTNFNLYQRATSLAGASGLMLYVDTDALGKDAQLRLRVRMQINDNGSTVDTVDIINAGTGIDTWVDTNSGQLLWMLTNPGAAAYYYNDDGTEGTLYIGNDVIPAEVDSSSNGDGNYPITNDSLSPLPAGFTGYVFIPMENFTVGGMYGGNYIRCRVPYNYVKEDALFADRLHLNHVITGTAESTTVTYGDFSLVYEDLEAKSTSVTLKNDLSLNVKLNATDKVSNLKATFTMGDKTATVTPTAVTGENGVYQASFDGILPQYVGDKVDVELSGTIDGRTATVDLSTSVKDYCVGLLATEGNDAAKKVASDLLRYAAAAQVIAEYNTDALATNGVALVAGSSVDKDAITAKYAVDGTPEGYGFTTAALRLEGRLGVVLKFNAASTDGLTVKVTVNGRENTYSSFKDEGNGVYSVVCENIGAGEMDAAITAVLSNGTATQTLTYSVADYIKTALNDTSLVAEETALVTAIYAYGLSASEYAQ